LNETITDALTGIALGLLLFAFLLLLRTDDTQLIAIPIGFGALWFIAQQVRRTRKESKK
jgi:hypothetical protein